MKLFVIFVLVILLVILVLNRKNELFMDEKLRSKIIRGIGLNMGEIENLESLVLKTVPNSEKLLIENIIKTYPIKKLIFSKNLQLSNYSNTIQSNLEKSDTEKLELIYNRRPLENIHNLPIAFAVGHDFKTNSKNPYYGFQFKYRITDGSFANRAEIGVEFKSYMDLKLEKLIKMSSKFEDEDYKNMERKRVEIMAQETKKFQFLPYFRDGNVKAIALFKDSKNKEFLQETEGYFNLNDERGNRILTKCKLDTPYCNTHLPQKGKIYGRDQYIASKFYPYDDNFRVIVNDNISAEELKKIQEQMEKAKQQNGINGINGQIKPTVQRWGSCKNSDECDGDDLYCRVGDKRCLTDEDCLLIKEREGDNTLNCDRLEKIKDKIKKLKDAGAILGPDGIIIGLKDELNGLALSYYNYCSNTKTPGAFIEKKLHKSNMFLKMGRGNIINSKPDFVYLSFDGFIKSPKTGYVIFRTRSDDGVRININGEKELMNVDGKTADSWIVQGQTRYTTKPISMKKDIYYYLKFEYFENEVDAFVELEWKWDNETDFSIVPADVLFTTSKLLDTKAEKSIRPKGIKYVGCYKNEGDRRIGTHIRNGESTTSFTIEECSNRSSVLFGMEYPEPWEENESECLVLNEIPDLEKVDDNECAVELDSSGRRLGAANRLAVYSNTDCFTEQFENRSKGIGNRIVKQNNMREGFVGDFQDTSNLPSEEQLPPFHNYYQKYLTKKDCVKDKQNLKKKIKDEFYLNENEINLVEKKKNLEPLRKLRGLNCIKHFDEFRDDFFFGGFDENNNMVCYGKDEECILFPNKKDCEKMDLNTLLSIPEEDIIKGLKSNRTLYDDETIKILKENLSAELEEKEDGFEVKCGAGKYLEGTFNPEDEIQILGGYYKDCTDPKHPKHENCSESPGESKSYHLSELITTKGRKKYDKSRDNKYSNFGDLDGKCIDNNAPEGRMGNCDPLDDFQPCYVGKRPSLVPGESIENTDIYNKYLGYNCHTYTLDTNTCKHNNMGVLSDVISFSDPKEKDYLNLINGQELLEMSTEYDFDMLEDEEKYRAKNLFMYMEKYFDKYEDMNPKKYFDLRYTLKFETYYDLITKKNEIILNIYYRGEKESSLHTNQGELHFLSDGDLVEVLITKENHVLFKVINPASKFILGQYTSINKIEGEFGSEINFYISQNNNSFIRDLKYKEEIPSTVLPYNPFVNIRQM